MASVAAMVSSARRHTAWSSAGQASNASGRVAMYGTVHMAQPSALSGISPAVTGRRRQRGRLRLDRRMPGMGAGQENARHQRLALLRLHPVNPPQVAARRAAHPAGVVAHQLAEAGIGHGSGIAG